MRIVRLLAASLILETVIGLTPNQAMAGSIKYDFTGKLTSSLGSISAGTGLSGYFWYDTPQDAFIGGPGYTVGAYKLQLFALTIGAETVHAYEGSSGALNTPTMLSIWNDTYIVPPLTVKDGLDISAPIASADFPAHPDYPPNNQMGGVIVQVVAMLLLDFTASVFSDAALPDSGLTLGLLQSNNANTRIIWGSPANTQSAYFTVNSLHGTRLETSVPAIPVPDTLGLLGIGLVGLGLVRRKRA